MDTLARVSLSEWNHHGTYTTADGKVEPPSQGLLDILMMPEHSDTAKLFEVSNQDIHSFSQSIVTGKQHGLNRK